MSLACTSTLWMDFHDPHASDFRCNCNSTKMLNISVNQLQLTYQPASPSKDHLEVYREAQLANPTCAATVPLTTNTD